MAPIPSVLIAFHRTSCRCGEIAAAPVFIIWMASTNRNSAAANVTARAVTPLHPRRVGSGRSGMLDKPPSGTAPSGTASSGTAPSGNAPAPGAACGGRPVSGIEWVPWSWLLMRRRPGGGDSAVGYRPVPTGTKLRSSPVVQAHLPGPGAERNVALRAYQPSEIEPRWQSRWEEEGLYRAVDEDDG